MRAKTHVSQNSGDAARLLNILNAEPKRIYLNDLIEAEDLCMLFGLEGGGKSYFAQLMSIVLAVGGNWYDKLVAPEPVKVLYVPTEGSEYDIAERFEYPWNFFSDKQDLIRENWSYWLPPRLDMANKSGVKLLKEAAKGYNVVFIDSLYSAFNGSVSDDAKMGEALSGIRESREPDQAIVVVHHEHRPRRDHEGEYIDEGLESIAGSFAIKAWASQIWRYQKFTEQTGSSKFVPLKKRSRHLHPENFHVEIDEKSGELTPSGVSSAHSSKGIRSRIQELGEISRSDAITYGKDYLNIEESTVDHNIGDLLSEGCIERAARGRYKWIGE